MDNGNPRFFGRPGFAALLFGLGLAVFSPPLLGIPARIGSTALWIYLITTWAGIIAILVGMAGARGRGAGTPAPPPPQTQGRP